MAAGAEAVTAGSPMSSPQSFGNPQISLNRASIQQKLGLVLAVYAVVTLLSGGWTWSQTPDYKVLFGNVSDRDGTAIIASLQQMNMPYKYAEGGGPILVPAKEVHDARLKLAAQGLPEAGLVGFDLMLSIRTGSHGRP